MLISNVSPQNICSMINHFDQTRSVLRKTMSSLEDESDDFESSFFRKQQTFRWRWPINKQAKPSKIFKQSSLWDVKKL